MRRLDDLGEEVHLDRLDLIKLDIEGHEDEFLRGGAGMITRHLPIIYMEVNKAYYRWRQVDLWDACSETVGTSHIAILPKWQRRAAWLVEKRLVGFQRLDGLAACARSTTFSWCRRKGWQTFQRSPPSPIKPISIRLPKPAHNVAYQTCRRY